MVKTEHQPWVVLAAASRELEDVRINGPNVLYILLLRHDCLLSTICGIMISTPNVVNVVTTLFTPSQAPVLNSVNI